MIAAMDTPVGMGRIFTMALPLAVRPPCGRRHVFSLYAIPSVVKNNSCVCVLATNRVVTTSSSLVCIPDRPLPPRRCARKSANGVRLIYPPAVTVTTISSRSIRSSSSMSPDHSTISVRRGTANCSLTSSNSVRMMPMMRSRDARISKYSRILPANSWSSSVTSLTPICVKRCRQFKDRAGLCFR